MVFDFLRKRLGLEQLGTQLAALATEKLDELDQSTRKALKQHRLEIIAYLKEIRTASDSAAGELEAGQQALAERVEALHHLVSTLQADVVGSGDRTDRPPRAQLATLDAISRLEGALRERLAGDAVREKAQFAWSKEVAQQISRLNGEQERLSGLVSGALKASGEREKGQATWAKEAAQQISRVRQELTTLFANGMNHFNERERMQADWAKQVALLLSRLRDRDFATVITRLEGVEHRLLADLRARARHDADLRNSRGAIDSSQSVADTPTAGGDHPDPLARAFGLRHPSPDPELEGLLSLGTWVEDDPPTASVLSRTTRARLRQLFPAGEHHVQTIRCRSGLDLEADMADVFAASAQLGWIEEANDFALFMAMVEPGTTVIDVGANFGLYASHAALYGGAEAQVIAFEPVPATFELLTENVRRNGLGPTCTCICAAVGDVRGHIQFNVAEDAAFSGIRDTGRSKSIHSIRTDLIPLDGCEEVIAAGPIGLIKIDVEGAEGAVLAGAAAVIEASPDILVMFEVSQKNLDAEAEAALRRELTRLERAGFGTFARGPGGMVQLRADALNVRRSENLFLCRPTSAAAQRLQTLAAQQARRAITPAEAAALALLKQQALVREPTSAERPQVTADAEETFNEQGDS